MLNAASLQTQLIRAQSLQQAGRPADAWSAIAPLRKAIDQHGQALRLYALIASSVEEVDLAADALRRILTIERDPPDIIGALADMLAKAGRHDQALIQWSRLAALQPRLADAHLNRAIAAADAGQPRRAIDAADTGLKHFPGHPRLLAVRAMALKNDGQLEQSLAAFTEAVAADPERALTRHNQAVALRAACRFDEACDAFAASLRLGMRGAHFESNWGAAALEAGRVDEAADHYRAALADDPAHGESLKALTRLNIEYRGGAQAFDHYAAALAARGSSLEAWRDWTNALLANYRYDLAIDIAERGLAAHPGDPMLGASAAFAAGMSGPAGPALERIESLYPARADGPLAWLSQLAIRAGRFDRAADYALQVTASDFTNQGAWSALSIAWRMLDDPREHWLCDYERLVMITDVPSADGAIPPDDYARHVADALDPLHQTLAAPGDQSLRDGTQTSGNLFDRPEPAIRAFRDAVRIAAEQAVATLHDDPTHPFLSRKSGQLGFSGSWSVRLRGGGGHHVSHYHLQGWMSSAYYARLPMTDAEGRARHEGWIQFGAPPAMYALDLAPRRLVEPAVGKLVLFPSYMLHGTIPFGRGPSGTSDRLTAAFDYLPL